MSGVLDIPAAEYHAHPALGSSSIRKILRSPAHYKAGAGEETDAMRFGTLVHECILEPEKWTKRVIAPRGDKRHKKVQEEWARFASDVGAPGVDAPWDEVDQMVAAGRITIMDAAQKATAEAMAESVMRHPLAAHMLRSTEVREGSYFWEEDGVPCKARIDAGMKVALIWDLKSAKDASPEGFTRAIAQHLYHVQDAHYSAGYEKLAGRAAEFAWIAVEKEPPFAVGVYTPDPEMREIGRLLRKRALATYRECMKSGKWPAYSERSQVVSLPRWAAMEVDSE